MEVKDKLIGQINNRGGLTPDNLRRIAEAVREVVPDFTLQYLRRLLAGHPPRDVDRRALESVLNLSPYTLAEEGEKIGGRPSGDIARFAASYLKGRVLAEKFVQHLHSEHSFRSKSLTDNDLQILLEDFIAQKQLEEEIELFGLGINDA